MARRLVAWLACAAAVLACGGSVGGGKTGGTPTVTITSPQDGASVAPGAVFVLAASASDAEDGDLSASVAWSDDQGELVGVTGATASVSLSAAGAHQITASVADKDGHAASAHVTVNVSVDVPIVTITEPAEGAHVHPGTVHLAGTAVDSDATSLSSQIEWTDSVESFSLQGAAVDPTFTQLGTHVITAKVTGKAGVGQAQVTIDVVANDPPNLVVSSPDDGAYVKVSTAVTLSAQAGDLEDCTGPTDWCLTDSIQWTVTPPGGGSPETFAGGSASFTPTATGDYTIAASITDGGSPAETTTITRVIHVGNNPPPVCTITDPNGHAPPSWAYAGGDVGFLGSCTDDTPVSASQLTWSVTPSTPHTATADRLALTAVPAGTYDIELCAPNQGTLTPGIDPAEGCTTLTLSAVTNTPPQCVIMAPQNDATVDVSQASPTNFDLTFTATDAQDPAVTDLDLTYLVDMRQGTGLFTPITTVPAPVSASPTTANIWVGAWPGSGKIVTRTFKVTLTDSGGATSSCEVTINAHGL